MAQFVAQFDYVQPDNRIGTAAGGPFVGDNVYNSTGTGQSKTLSVHRGHTGTLYVSIQNDGLRQGTATVHGTGTASGFTVKYFNGATDVTAAVKAGTYSAGSIPPNSTIVLKMTIKLSGSSAAKGTFKVTTSFGSGSPEDTVKALVKAT